MKEYRPCEAPAHIADCSGVGSTKDHFTPRCIGKILGWSRRQINAPENIQRLSPACHREKDRSTSLRKEEVLFQLRGGNIDLGEHLQRKIVEMQPSKWYPLKRSG